jgi:CBS domain containing-hemolysin-like protein
MSILLLGLSVLLVIACGAFVAAEFAFITVDRLAVEREAEAGDRSSRRLLGALQTLSTQLSGAQLGITITNLAIGFLAEPAIADLLESPLRGLGIGHGAVTAVAVAIALVLATAATMVFGELVPKNLALARPAQTARRVAGFQRGFTRAMALPIKVLNATANRVLHAVGVEPQEELASARSAEELSSLLARSAELGTLPGSTAALLQQSLVFGDKVADDIMTPRSLITTVREDDSLAAVIAASKRTGHSRFPVVAADADHVVGAIHIRHAVSVPEEQRRSERVGAHLVTVSFVPSTLHLDPLLDRLRSTALLMAIVVDEFGGTAGLVTLEDLVEELVGEVSDEHDRYGPPVQRRRDGSWSLSGLLRPDEVAAQTGIEIPEHRAYDTLGGLLAQRLGRLPHVGDAIDLGHATLTVTHLAGRRVDRVRLAVREGDTPEPTDTAVPR